MEVEVFTGRQSKQLIISKDSVQMQGQTSGEWYLVGKYDLKKGGDIRVTVSNRHADGEVIGDAVLFHRNN
jgi:hypothetical protein